jgi:lipopolysaccharide transport system ATP-binding protein
MSEGEGVIRAAGLGKRYWLGGAAGARFETLRESLASLMNRRGRRASSTGTGIFWALKDVTFDVHAGEVLGIIGHNGAGKSTLLKIISRITDPTEGEVEIQGRLGSLLEVGTGFHPELTGRENVYLNGAILGMRRAEIVRKFDEIVAFAEVETFLDTPVKHYSSGMYMRLAFAVAAHLEPDILIVDEILAVGDAAFQKKCLGKMGDVARHGRTVLFVSHSMGAIRSLCTRALVMSKGRLQFNGTAEEAIAYYLANSAAGSEQDGQISFEPEGLKFEDLRLYSVRVLDQAGVARALFDAGELIRVEIEYDVLAHLRGARTVLFVSTQEGELAFQSTDHLTRQAEQPPGRYRTSCTIPAGLLNRRKYLVDIGFEIPWSRTLALRQQYVSFVVSGGGNQGSTLPEPWPGVVCPSMNWLTERV